MKFEENKSYRIMTVTGEYIINNVFLLEDEIKGNLISSNTEITILKKYIVAYFVYENKTRERNSIDLSK